MAGETGAKLEGLETVMSNLNARVAEIGGGTMAGLMAAGLQVQGTAQKRVPVEYGNLRQSAYTRKAQANEFAVEVGFSAAYAVFVHENMDQKLKGKPRPSGLGVYWGPEGQPKFLESAVRDETSNILNIIVSYAKR